MEQNDINQNRKIGGSKIWTGLVLLIAGLLLLGYKMGAPIPEWIFTWPVLLIAIGILVGLKSRFQNPGSFIMILIGAIFLADQSIPGINFHNFITPVILIAIGLLFILRPHGWRRYGPGCRHRHRWNNFDPVNNASANYPNAGTAHTQTDDSEYIDIQAVFGSVKKNILSKNFKGGEIVSFMGGSEVNFMQADLQHPVVLEVNNVFGGTKIIIPSNWDMKNEVTAIFGGIEDKRNINAVPPDPAKIIILKGACVFGGIEISNY